MDITNENKFETFSYESYLSDAIEGFKDIKSVENFILTENMTFEKQISIIKNQYRTLSLEDDNVKEETKRKFSETIKNWFIKIWSFLCEIFSRIYEIIIALVKSLIIYFQKKKLQAHNIIKEIEEKGLEGFNKSNNDILLKTISSNKKIKMVDLKTSSNEKNFYTSDPCSFINFRLKNRELQDFVNGSIILKNPNSIFSTDSLNKYALKELMSPDQSEDLKLSKLEAVVDDMYGNAIISNEIDPKHMKPSTIVSKYASYIETKNISGLAHNIVFGLEKPGYTEMTLPEFFGLKTGESPAINIEALKNAYRYYKENTELVLGNKGYINTLQEILKRYKDQAKKDNENIKQMSKTILGYLNSINSTETSGEKVQHRCNRFTQIVMKVKNMKAHFIRLRQCVILDIITLFSIENTAWYIITGKGQNFLELEKVDDLDVNDTLRDTDE